MKAIISVTLCDFFDTVIFLLRFRPSGFPLSHKDLARKQLTKNTDDEVCDSLRSVRPDDGHMLSNL